MYEIKQEIEVTKPSGKSTNKFKKGNIGLVLGSIALLVISIFLYFTFTNLNSELNMYKDLSNTGIIEQKRVQELLEKVSKLMILPNESPTVAALINVEGLKKDNPSFYEHALEGDVLIIYTNKAILYRESENILVNVAPVFINPAEQELDNVVKEVNEIEEEISE